jgi:hypothetical protein
MEKGNYLMKACIWRFGDFLSAVDVNVRGFSVAKRRGQSYHNNILPSSRRIFRATVHIGSQLLIYTLRCSDR